MHFCVASTFVLVAMVVGLSFSRDACADHIWVKQVFDDTRHCISEDMRHIPGLRHNCNECELSFYDTSVKISGEDATSNVRQLKKYSTQKGWNTYVGDGGG